MLYNSVVEEKPRYPTSGAPLTSEAPFLLETRMLKSNKGLVNNLSKQNIVVNNSFETVIFNLKAPTRYDEMEGKKYLVVPMIMMKEGVHSGSAGPLYYPEEELAKTPAMWNYKPIVVYHPTMNGVGVSACDPDILTNRKVGVIMNAEYKDHGLKSEAWLEEDRLNKVDNRITEAIEKGQMVEVSTGVFTDHDFTEGVWNGKAYPAIARNHRPDHLAILPDLIGACSIEDGAGLLRLNQEAYTNKEYQAIGERLVNMVRGKGQGQGGPKQGDGGTDTCVCPKCGETTAHERGTPCTNKTCPKCGAGMVGNERSHNDLHQALGSLIESTYGDKAWIADIYDTFCIFEKEGILYRQEYSETDSSVALVGPAVEVLRVTEYRTLKGEFIGNQRKESDVDKKKMVDAIIANSKWVEDDRTFLMELDEKRLEKMLPVENKEDDKKPGDKKEDPPVKKEDPKTPVQSAAEEGAKDLKPAEKKADPVENKEVTVDEYIANAPVGIRDMLASGVKAHEAEKAKLIKVITANEANMFTEDQLKAKGMGELQAIATLAAKPEAPAVPNALYAGMPAPSPTENKEEPLVMPVMNFGKEEK